jgi:hypothetical protein
MGKWIAGILGAVLTGVILWVLTDKVLPVWFAGASHDAPIADTTRVECVASPATVAPGGTTEISVKVFDHDGPIEGATVDLAIGGGTFGSQGTTAKGETYSGGIFRTTWKAPSPSAAGYVFPANVTLDGLRTAKGELHGAYRTNCEILVR